MRQKELGLLTTSTVPVWVHIVIILFCVFAFWDPDYYHYKEALNDTNMYYSFADQQTKLEIMYLWLYDFCSRNYLLFRTIVWGGAYLLFMIMAKKIGAYDNLTFALFIILFLLMFSYARVSLGMVTLFLGAILLASTKHNLLRIIFAAALLLLCYHSHKSMIVPLCLLPLCFIKLNRCIWPFIVMIVIFLVVYYSDFITVTLFENTDASNEADQLQETIQIAGVYNENSQAISVGLGLLLQRVVQYTSIIVPLILMFKKEIYQYLQNNIECRVLYNSALLIVVVAMSMGVLTSLFSALCYRFLYMAYIPIILLTSVLYRQKYFSEKQLSIIVALAGFCVWYRLLYATYLTMMS
ncbi:MAG: EpsG family protein [Alistipes sp.]|nr:EpsG family protein [Alistipes sp.]